MNEKIKELLKEHQENLDRAESIQSDLRNKAKFCQEHKFCEDERKLFTQLDAMGPVIHDYKTMINALEEIIQE